MSLGLQPYQQPFSREELIQPFLQAFDQSALKFKSQLSIGETLDVLFPEQKRQDKDLAKAREALGELSHGFNDQQLKEILTDIDFLVAHWLDDFERTIFDGQTLRELLHEKGGLL